MLFHKFVTADVARIILRDGTLRWSSPIEFNDMSDSIPDRLRLGFSASDLVGATKEFLANQMENGEFTETGNATVDSALRMACQAPPSERAGYAHIYRTVHDIDVKGQDSNLKLIQESWPQYMRQSRFLCFSRTDKCEKMWGFYGGSNRGFVFSFHSPPGINGDFTKVRRIHYTDAPSPIFDPNAWAKAFTRRGPPTAQLLLQNLAFRKKKIWTFEQEERVAKFGIENGTETISDYPFNPMDLRRIVAGPRCNVEDLRSVEKLMIGPFSHVQLAKAFFDATKREIEIAQ